MQTDISKGDLDDDAVVEALREIFQPGCDITLPRNGRTRMGAADGKHDLSQRKAVDA